MSESSCFIPFSTDARPEAAAQHFFLDDRFRLRLRHSTGRREGHQSDQALINCAWIWVGAFSDHYPAAVQLMRPFDGLETAALDCRPLRFNLSCKGKQALQVVAQTGNGSEFAGSGVFYDADIPARQVVNVLS